MDNSINSRDIFKLKAIDNFPEVNKHDIDMSPQERANRDRKTSLDKKKTNEETYDKLWSLMDQYIGHDKESIQKQILSKIEYTLAKSRFDFNINHCCIAVKLSLFDRLIECGNDSNSHFTAKDCKRAYILSDQGLSSTNKSLKSILINLNLEN